MSVVTTDLDKIVAQLEQGQAAAIPTETVYGLAARGDQPAAVKKIFALKNRPLHHPLILHIASGFDVASLVTEISEDAKRLMQHFWPGPLTLVFKRKMGCVLDEVTGGQSTVAIRCPAHALTQQVLMKLGKPLVAPSANVFGKISPTTAQHVQEGFVDEPFYILEGGRCKLGIESTIISVVESKGYQLLRAGAVTEDQLNGLVLSLPHHPSELRVPGGLKQHYQPQKPLYCFETSEALRAAYQQATAPVFVLAFEPCGQVNPTLFYQLSVQPAEAAYELYFRLHQADKTSASAIYAQLPPLKPEWAGIRDRMMKAGVYLRAGKINDVQ